MIIKKHIRQYGNTVLDMGINTEYKWPVGSVGDGIKQQRRVAPCSWIIVRVCKAEQNKMEVEGNDLSLPKCTSSSRNVLMFPQSEQLRQGKRKHC